MRRLTSVCCLLLAFSSAAFAQKSDKYESTDGKFKLSFPPGKIETNERQADSNAGKITFKMATWSSEKGDQAVIVSYVDYILGKDQTFDKEKGLDGGVDGAVKKAGTELVGFIGKIEFGKDKLPGRTFDMKKTSPVMYGKNLMVMKGMRMYHVIVVGDEDFALGKKGREIVNSFELTK